MSARGSESLVENGGGSERRAAILDGTLQTADFEQVGVKWHPLVNCPRQH